MGNTQTKQAQFVAAALEGDTQHLHECMSNFDRGSLLDFSTGLWGGRESLLHLAAKTGKAETISAVVGSLVASVTTEIADGAYPGPAAALLTKVVNKQDSKGRTPLLTACYHGHWDCAELLLEAGSNVFACDKDGNGVLHLAAINGHLQLVQQLLAKADTQAISGRLASTVNLSGFSPLHYAAWAGQADVVRSLLAAGVDQLQASHDEYDRWLMVPQGSTPLHVAAGTHHSGVCLMLLQHYALQLHEWLPGDPVPVDPRSRQDQRNTLPVQVAAWKGLAPDSQLAMCLDPRVDMNFIFSPQQLDEIRCRGPPALRMIAAAAVKQHLLQQLAVLLEQQQQEQRWRLLQKQAPRQQQMNLQRHKQQQKQQQQQGRDGEQHNWQRWWGKGSNPSTGAPERHAAGGADCSAAASSSHASSSHASSLGRANAAVTDSSSSKSSIKLCGGAGSNQHHANDDYSEIWQGLNRTPSITLGAVHGQYSKTVGEDDQPDDSSSSAGRSCRPNWQQQRSGYAAQNGAGSSNGRGEIEAAGDDAAAAAGAATADRRAAAAGSSDIYGPAKLSAAVVELGVDIDQAVDREQCQLLASSSITLGCLDKIWSVSEQHQLNITQTASAVAEAEAFAGEVEAAAGSSCAAAACSSSRPSSLAEIEIEVEVASLDAAQQPRTPPQVTPGPAVNNTSPAAAAAAAASSSAASAAAAIRSSVSGQHFSSSGLHKATGSTGEFPLVTSFAVQGTAGATTNGKASVLAANKNKKNGLERQLVVKPKQLPPLKTSSITLAQLSSRSSKAAAAAAETGQKQDSGATAAAAGVLATAGIKSQDLQQLLTPLSWKLFQQQRQQDQQETNPSQQEQHQQRRSRCSFSLSTPGSTVAGAGSGSSVESSNRASAAAGPPAAPTAAASGTGGTAGSSRRALWERMAPGSSSSRTQRRSFELPGASGVLAVFGANRQHVARMLHEAGSVDPRTLYKTLTKAGGTLAVATSLAGALPGCVSDKLVQCVEVSSSINGGGAAASCVAAAAAGASGTMNSSRVSFDRRSNSSAHSEVCAVCMDQLPAVALAGCGHVLCFDCARCIVQEGVGSRAPLCPFCRLNMTGFGLMPLAPGRGGGGA